MEFTINLDDNKSLALNIHISEEGKKRLQELTDLTTEQKIAHHISCMAFIEFALDPELDFESVRAMYEDDIDCVVDSIVGAHMEACGDSTLSN